MTYPPIETVAFIGVGAMVIPMTGHLQQRFGLGLIAEGRQIASDLADEFRLRTTDRTSGAWQRAFANIGASSDHIIVISSKPTRHPDKATTSLLTD